MRLEIYYFQVSGVQVVFGVEKLAKKYHLAPSSSVLGTIVGSQSVFDGN